VNLAGTLNLLEASRQAGVEMFVNASSSSVYGDNTKAPFEETDALLNPASPYGATKLGAEALTRVFAHAYDMRAISLRFFTVYGPRQRPDMAITKFMSRMLDEQPITIFGDGGAQRDFTFVGDIVDGILASCDYEASRYEAINLGSGRTVTLLQLVEQMDRGLGLQSDQAIRASANGRRASDAEQHRQSETTAGIRAVYTARSWTATGSPVSGR
jgi:UDP-glucuronate 4-epimerase